MLLRSPTYFRNLLFKKYANGLSNQLPDGLLMSTYHYRHYRQEIQTSEEINRMKLKKG